MRFLRHIVACGWPLGLAALLLSGMAAPGTLAPTADASAAAPAGQEERPSVARPGVFAPAALLPLSPRLPSVAENRSPGTSQFEESAGETFRPALSDPLSPPTSQRLLSAEEAGGALDTSCSFLCVFRC